MASATPGRIAAIVVLIVVALGAIRWSAGFLTTDRPIITSSPSLGGAFASNEVRLRPGSRICIAPVPFEPDSRLVRVNVTSATRAVPLTVTAQARGYSAQGRLENYTVGPGVGVDTMLAPPAREVIGRLCVRNDGRLPVGLTGTQEPRSLVYAKTTLNGRELPNQGIAVTFFAARPQSLLDRAGTILTDISELGGGLLPRWLLWPLALLFVIGVPLLSAGAFLLGGERRP